MKEKDLILNFPDHQVVYYAEKSDGTYGPLQTGCYMTGNYIDEHFRITGSLNRSLLEQLKNGEISPICYYMNIEMLTIPELASRVGISQRSLKKHLSPKGFQKLSISKLKRYADVLNIQVANMFQIIDTIEDKNWNAGYEEKVRSSKPYFISQGATKNPLLVETKIIANSK
ncbi:MAG: helix-turn-helix transcriptional regulator [Bacteroidia bacterium]|jgi:transcriptional regulator with XRE-family HTH domain|nr:helix-turn-helix transcriptional regulator [Bacteroidia bacterium]